MPINLNAYIFPFFGNTCYLECTYDIIHSNNIKQHIAQPLDYSKLGNWTLKYIKTYAFVNFHSHIYGLKKTIHIFVSFGRYIF